VTITHQPLWPWIVGPAGLATDELASPLAELVYYPGYDPRPADTLPQSHVSEHLLPRRGHGGEASEVRVGVDADHIEALRRRVASGLPPTGGYHGSRTLAGFDAE
jgi:hypothetical protein